MAGLGGFMPAPGPGATYGGNWSQDWGDVMNTLVAAEQANARQNYGNSPMGGSFLDRFTGSSPLGRPAMEPQVAAPLPDFAALQGALAQAAQQSGQFIENGVTRQTGVPYAGPMIDASEGALRGQPWYDEYVAAAQANPGASMPMIVGSGGVPRDMDKANAYRANRDAEMESRRNAVQQQAIAKAEQRASRMGDLSGNQQYFNELARLQGALGGGQGGGGNVMNIALGGPEFAVGMAGIDQRDREAQMKTDLLRDPLVVWSRAMEMNPNVMLADIQQQMEDPTGYKDSQMVQAAPTFDVFAGYVQQNGGSREQARQQWIASGKPDPDAPGLLDYIKTIGPLQGFLPWVFGGNGGNAEATGV